MVSGKPRFFKNFVAPSTPKSGHWPKVVSLKPRFFYFQHLRRQKVATGQKCSVENPDLSTFRCLWCRKVVTDRKRSVQNPDFVIFLGPSAPKRGRLPKVVSRKSWCLNFPAPSAAKSGHLLNVVRGDSRFLNFLATSAPNTGYWPKYVNGNPRFLNFSARSAPKRCHGLKVVSEKSSFFNFWDLRRHKLVTKQKWAGGGWKTSNFNFSVPISGHWPKVIRGKLQFCWLFGAKKWSLTKSSQWKNPDF